MAEDSDLEKTEPASGRKVEQAREQGNVPHSRELATFAILMTSALTIMLMGDHFYTGLRNMLLKVFSFDREAVVDPSHMARTLIGATWDVMLTFAPLGLALIVVAVAANLLVSGWNFTTQALEPKFDRLDPIQGIARMFSWQSIIELLKAVLKSAVIGGVAGWMLWNQRDDLVNLAAEPLNTGIGHFGWITLMTFLAAAGAFALIAIIDVPLQLWQYYYKLRMSKQEVIEENKQTQGDPMIRGRIRRMQREMARRRMMAAVPKAEVVVTNPMHFAVALKYDDKRMSAPQVVAKGSQLVAARIKEIARENGVPIVEAPPLARALHRHVEIGDTIPGTLFTAVAQVLAYVYQLKQAKIAPSLPDDWQVPAGMDPEARA
ncbi:MAG: flagellar type III secretion system protein FlhB [Hydrogenophilaceae bacterium]|nr:flagellar type III secretion system protein FlhB [Hydrogenophilaceae bacterium]